MMLQRLKLVKLLACCTILIVQETSAARPYDDQRFTARYDTCNDKARFVLSPIDDGDCQVLCGPSGDSKLFRLKDKSVCKTPEKNEQGVCMFGRCVAAPVVAEKATTTRKPVGLPRTTNKFVPSTVVPVTSGLTYPWQKWATYQPSVTIPTVSTDNSKVAPLSSPKNHKIINP